MNVFLLCFPLAIEQKDILHFPAVVEWSWVWFIDPRIHLDPSLKQDDTVLLVYPPSLDFIVVFISCLRAGIIAVPVYPPGISIFLWIRNSIDPSSLKKNMYLFKSVQENCQATVALTSRYLFRFIEMISCIVVITLWNSSPTSSPFSCPSPSNGLNWSGWSRTVTFNMTSNKTFLRVFSLFFSIEEIDESWTTFTDDKLMFLQYTSGSTSLPKVFPLNSQEYTRVWWLANLICLIIFPLLFVLSKPVLMLLSAPGFLKYVFSILRSQTSIMIWAWLVPILLAFIYPLSSLVDDRFFHCVLWWFGCLFLSPQLYQESLLVALPH